MYKRMMLAICLIVVSLILPGSFIQAESIRDVVISEVAWMGTATSANDEWLELYNNTDHIVDLNGWSLVAADGTPSITLQGTIPAKGYFLLERSNDDSVPGVAADQTYTGALNNDGEALTLSDSFATTIDSVDCSSGWFAGHSDGRVPMARIDLTAAGDSANWTHNPRCGDATNAVGVSHTCALTVTNVGADLDYAVYFNDLATTASTITTTVTSMEAALLALIDNATTSIDVALYGLNRESIVAALISAHTRGVTVRVVGDDDAATGDYSSSYQALVNAGMTVVTDTSSYIQHNKFFVVDGQIVWTGSTNLTDTGFTLNANNSLIITSTQLATVYTTEFEEMWAGKFHNDKAENTLHLLDYNGTLVESYFSPTDLVAFEVWDELQQAETALSFAMFFWTDALLTEQVVALLDDIEVWGVWDQLGAASATSADEALCAAGAHIKFEDFPGKVHHKFAVIDVDGDNPTVILGSYNWTSSGGYDNDENTLIIHDRALAQAYHNEWQRLWDALDTDNMCNPLETTSLTTTLSGPAAGEVDTLYTFTATIEPPTTVFLPYNYTWETPSAAPIYHADGGITDTATFAWSMPGIHTVTVTVTSTYGVISDTHLITITPPVEPSPLVTLSGPTAGELDTSYTFTATIDPPAMTFLPYNYTWKTSGAAPIYHADEGITDTATFAWDTPGLYMVTVTVTSTYGTISDTHLITITPPVELFPFVMLSGPTVGELDTLYTFTATIEPPTTAFLPYNYTWETPGAAPIYHANGGVTDTVAFAWDTPGIHTVTVTVTSTHGTISDTHLITITSPVEPFPFVTLSGPTAGELDTSYTFTATIEPPTTAFLPYNYTWETLGATPIYHADEGITDTATFTWSMSGIHMVTVTVTSTHGTTSDIRSITIAPPTEMTVFLPLVVRN